jgi:hypothetical protein
MRLEMAIMRYVAPPVASGEITGDDVKALVKQFDYKYFQPIDTTYRAVTLDSLKTFLQFDKTSDFSYVKQFFDCDDFQMVLAGRLKLWYGGIPSGLLFVKGHAVNVIVAEQNNEYKLFKIEPQNDTITEVTGDDEIVFVIL